MLRHNLRAGIVSIFSMVSVSGAVAQPTYLSLQTEALKDTVAWDITEGLSTEIGPRYAGTDAEARARAWSVAKLKSLGFTNVRIEPYNMPVWLRGDERAEIVSPYPQPLVITGIGGSASTPPNGVTGAIEKFTDLETLRAVPDRALAGKIVYLSHAMAPTQDASGYSALTPLRRLGPSVAAQKGALAIVVRSLGTGHNRMGHAGGQVWDKDVNPIPAAALSNADADQLDRILGRGQAVTLRLTMTSKQLDHQSSGNVIVDIPGRDPALGMVLVSCHLDSWDTGTGALDDAAGCGMVTAAAKLIMDNHQPLRSIRIVWFGSEEVGLHGAYAYRDKHRDQNHAIVSEADLGADRVWSFSYRVGPQALPLMKHLATALAPLGIGHGDNQAVAFSDIRPLADLGIPIMVMRQDATRYFDLHHTANDTLDKVDIDQLRQNVAAWTTFLAIIANSDQDLSYPIAK